MRVLLKRDFFYAGQRYRMNQEGTKLPDEAESALPSDAVVIDEPEIKRMTRKPRKQTSDAREVVK